MWCGCSCSVGGVDAHVHRSFGESRPLSLGSDSHHGDLQASGSGPLVRLQ